ncbi:MAG: hypothetical protein ACRDT1_02080 [Micromonosporaceae bacterium]
MKRQRKRSNSEARAARRASGDAAVAVAVVPSRTEAELIAGMLRNHDVAATVAADDAGAQYPSLQATDGVRVLVTPSDEDQARQLIAAVDDTDSTDG